MPLPFLSVFLLAAQQPQPVSVYSFRTADGIEHFVGQEADIPPSFRGSVRRIDLEKIPLNSDISKLPQAEDPAPAAAPAAGSEILPAIRAALPQRTDGKTPTLPGSAIAAAVLLCLFPGLVFVSLRATRFRSLWMGLAAVDLAAGLGLALHAAKLERPTGARDLLGLSALQSLSTTRKVVADLNAAQADRERQMLGEAPDASARAPTEPASVTPP